MADTHAWRKATNLPVLLHRVHNSTHTRTILTNKVWQEEHEHRENRTTETTAIG